MNYTEALKAEIEDVNSPITYANTPPVHNAFTVKRINTITGGTLSETATVAEIDISIANLKPEVQESIRRDEFHNQSAINQAIADQLNEVGQSIPNTSISAEQVKGVFTDQEFASMTGDAITKLNFLLTPGFIAPNDSKLIALLNGKIQTLAALDTLTTKQVSRIQELGIFIPRGIVREGHIATARASL